MKNRCESWHLAACVLHSEINQIWPGIGTQHEISVKLERKFSTFTLNFRLGRHDWNQFMVWSEKPMRYLRLFIKIIDSRAS